MPNPASSQCHAGNACAISTARRPARNLLDRVWDVPAISPESESLTEVRVQTPGYGRFAPSPTSDLHVGNLRTALLAWLFARLDGLGFLVRIEDLDQQRVAAARGVEQRQLADLRRLGIDWDAEPVRQSERRELYRDAANQLDTYPCFCTRRDIAEASQAPQGEAVSGFRPYPGTCSRLSTAQQQERARTRPAATRVRAEGATFRVSDRHAGTVTGVVDDFVLFRADGTPAYNLAVVVDDGLQNITQVTRGNDLLDSSPRQGWLANRLGFSVPEYVHVGLGLNPTGQRLAKRDGAVTLADLAAAGVESAAVFRQLVRLCSLPDAESAPELLAKVASSTQVNTDAVWSNWTWNAA